MSPPRRPDWDGLFARRTLGIRLGLEVVQGVYDALGRPAQVPAVHIVGTNGKGSTAAMVAHALARPAARVGLYTSPHLHRVTERVVVNGEPVAESVLWDAVRSVDAAELRAPQSRRLSFFEVLTLAAMVVFEQAGATELVAEAGLGGRLDATRVVNPAVVAVTSISRDHTAWLGEDLESIAGEKAGVFAAGVPVVSAPQVPVVAAVLRRAAERVGCSIRFAEPLPVAPAGLVGSHQCQNGGVALAVLRRLAALSGRGTPTAHDLDGVRWVGRLETLAAGPGRVTLDAAHNEDACCALARAIEGVPSLRPTRIVAGCQADKDSALMREALGAIGVPIDWVELDGLDDDDPAPWQTVRSATQKGEHVLVCGSHLLVAAIRVRVLAQGTPVQQGAHELRADPSDPR